MVHRSLSLVATIQHLSVCLMFGYSTLLPWSGSNHVPLRVRVLFPTVATLHVRLGQISPPHVEAIPLLLLGIQCLFLAVMEEMVTSQRPSRKINLKILFAGYARRDLDDLHCLDIKQWAWMRVGAKGRSPERRSGHQACAVESSLFVLGGWNASKQFDDLYILDTVPKPPVWACVENSLPAPRWNFAACSVMAIPSWKVFLYGGVEGPLNKDNRQGILSDAVAVLDAGLNRWSYPSVGGTLHPRARADTVLAYDGKSSRLVLFGGWANEWLEDIFTLDVAHVVGPPYAIMDLRPRTGPVTGATPIQLVGIDFSNTKDVVVRFSSKCGTADVSGEFLSNTQLACVAPDFSSYPAGEVEVRIALNGDSFTTTSQVYTFFAVTSAAHSLIYGPGLLNGGACNEETMFVIQARDSSNKDRTSGGDEFKVNIRLLGGGDEGSDLQLRGVQVSDNDNGTYHVCFTAQSPGQYLVETEFQGTFGGSGGEVRGSGVFVTFEEFVPRSNNSMAGKLVAAALEQDISTLGQTTKSILTGVRAKPSDESWTDLENQHALVAVKEHLNMIQNKKQEINLLIDRVGCILSQLKLQGVNIGPQENMLELYRTSWDDSQQEAPAVALRIAPLIKAQGSRTKYEVQSYESKVRQLLQEVESASFRLYDTGVDKALELLAVSTKRFESEQIGCKNMIHLANMFECPADMAKSSELLDSIGNILDAYRGVWACADECTSYINEASSLNWEDLNADGLEENAKLILTKVKQQPATIKEADAYRGLEQTAKQFLVTCPLISSLRQPSMRDRHWNMLTKVTGSMSAKSNVSKELTLADILSLNLHLHVSTVNDITERASREATHEETLVALATTWKNVNFKVSSYKDTVVPLLKITEEDADQLEADQLALQSILASRYDYFKSQATEWQCALVAVSEVVQMLSEIQRTWSYLEPLFIGSEEVQKELPEDALRFAGIDDQVRKVLRGMAETRNVRQACQQKGLLHHLESMNSDQDLCKKALADFLAGKRRTFPR